MRVVYIANRISDVRFNDLPYLPEVRSSHQQQFFVCFSVSDIQVRAIALLSARLSGSHEEGDYGLKLNKATSTLNGSEPKGQHKFIDPATSTQQVHVVVSRNKLY